MSELVKRMNVIAAGWEGAGFPAGAEHVPMVRFSMGDEVFCVQSWLKEAGFNTLGNPTPGDTIIFRMSMSALRYSDSAPSSHETENIAGELNMELNVIHIKLLGSTRIQLDLAYLDENFDEERFNSGALPELPDIVEIGINKDELFDIGYLTAGDPVHVHMSTLKPPAR